MTDTFNHTVCGIPCKIRIDSFESAEGSYSRNAVSDLDYHGYTEIEYTILDSKGYEAGWLQRKVSPADNDAIEASIIEYKNGESEAYEDFLYEQHKDRKMMEDGE